MTGIIRAAHYDTEEARIADHPITRAMLVDLPEDTIDKLAAGDFIPDFMMSANREWNRRATARNMPGNERPAHLGAPAAALGILARRLREDAP